MTDRPRPYHRAEAERLLDYADEWAAKAGELTPEANERACLAHAQVHALLAIHDTLADLKPEPVTYPRPSGPVTMTHPWPPWPSTLPDVDAADRYAANEAKQRGEAEPDPLDEDDHRDRQDRDGMRLTRVGPHHWHPTSGARCGLGCNGLSLANWNSSYGPLAFAPDATPDAPRATAPVADDPADDAVDGEEGERRYLNAQTGLEPEQEGGGRD